MPALILQLSRIGFLVLLWLFILAAIRVIRADLRVAADGRVGTDGRPTTRRAQRRDVARPRSTTPTILVVTAGSMAGTRIRLGGGPILIGRAEDSTLVLDDDYASARHARLVAARRRIRPGGPRLHQRHVSRPQPRDLHHPGSGRRTDPNRPHGHGASPVSDAGAERSPTRPSRRAGERSAERTIRPRERRRERRKPDAAQPPGQRGANNPTPWGASPATRLATRTANPTRPWPTPRPRPRPSRRWAARAAPRTPSTTSHAPTGGWSGPPTRTPSTPAIASW